MALTAVESRDTDPYAGIPVAQLANFAFASNIWVERVSEGERSFFFPDTQEQSTRQGILIGIMDLEPSKRAVKVLVNEDFEYWSTDVAQYVRSTPREWKKL